MNLATSHPGAPVSRMPNEGKPASSPLIPLRMIRLKHIIVALLLSVFFFFVFCFIALHAYIAWVLSNPTVAPLYSNPYQAKGLAYEDISFPAKDGSRMMEGWYIPSKGATKTIIFSHGYGANREESWVPMYDLAHYAHSLRFNVVMFDYGFASKTDRDIATGGKKNPSSCSEPLPSPRRRSRPDCGLGLLDGCRHRPAGRTCNQRCGCDDSGQHLPAGAGHPVP